MVKESFVCVCTVAEESFACVCAVVEVSNEEGLLSAEEHPVSNVRIAREAAIKDFIDFFIKSPP